MANKYITTEYLTKRMTTGSSLTFVASIARLNLREHQKEQNAVVHAIGWEETEKALGKLSEKSPSNFAYIYAKRCICQFAAEQAVELGKCGIRINTVMPGSTQSGMKDEFRGFLILLFDMLEHGDVERAIAKIREILG